MKHVQKVIRGRGKIRDTGKLAEALNMHRPMIVGLEPLTGVFLRGNPDYADRPVFSVFHANPDLSDAAAGAESFRENGCDSLISVFAAIGARNIPVVVHTCCEKRANEY